MSYQDLQTQRTEVLKQMDEYVAKLDKGETPTEEERQAFTELQTRAETLVEELDVAQKQQETRNKLANHKPVEKVSIRINEPNKEVREELNSLNVRSLSNNFISQYDGSRQFNFNGELDVRATISHDSTFTSDTFNSGQLGTINPIAKPLIIDVINKQSTSLGSISYLQAKGSSTGNAGTVAEGSVKPEGDNDFDTVVTPVQKIAVYQTVSEEVLEDHAGMQSIIEDLLTRQVRAKLASQIIAGDGTAPNLRGIANTSGINTHAPAGAEEWLKSVRNAITAVQNANGDADTLVINPTDWALIEMSGYESSSVPLAAFANSSAKIFGLTPIVTTAVGAGQAIVGSFANDATLYTRKDVNVRVSDSHASNFTSNLITVLAEVRAGLIVPTPKAFCKVTFNAGV